MKGKVFFNLSFLAFFAWTPFVFTATANAYEVRTSSLLVEADAGRVLLSENATDRRYPASLTKMMTLYMVFDALERGEIKMDQLLPVSRKASRQPRSRMGLKEGTTISVENAIFAMISKSANDAAVVVAEALAGSEEQFADKMTRVARELGMKSTRFKNASGLHHKDQVTTAQDMVVLSEALIDHFPEYYKLFSVRGFRYGRRYYGNHNLVARFYKGGDGLKTGYVDAAGYHVVGSAKRGGKRLIGVIMGRNSVRERDRHMFRLLDFGFQKLGSAQSSGNGEEAAALFAGERHAVSPSSEAEYRRIRIEARRLSEELDGITGIADVLSAKRRESVVKKAIVDWGQTKTRSKKSSKH